MYRHMRISLTSHISPLCGRSKDPHPSAGFFPRVNLIRPAAKRGKGRVLGGAALIKGGPR